MYIVIIYRLLQYKNKYYYCYCTSSCIMRNTFPCIMRNILSYIREINIVIIHRLV